MLIVEDLFLFINQDMEIEISAVYPKIENVSVQFIHCLYIRMGNNDSLLCDQKSFGDVDGVPVECWLNNYEKLMFFL